TDPLKTPTGLTDPLKAPTGVTDPLKPPTGLADPLKAPTGLADPLKTLTGLTDPLKAPAGVTDPLKAPAGVAVIPDPLKPMDVEPSPSPVDLLAECAVGPMTQVAWPPAADASGGEKMEAASALGEASQSRTLPSLGLAGVPEPAVKQEVDRTSPSPRGGAGNPEPGAMAGDSFVSPARLTRAEEKSTKLNKPSPQTDRPKQQAASDQQGSVESPEPPPATTQEAPAPGRSDGKSEQRPQTPSETVEVALSGEACDRLSDTAGKSFAL
ncbi:hypothetical protein scyTo_0027164, partial [Scyliorhinus torazame]|nr:hypothetical protein [Scyliorhinus torazame]